MSAGFPNLAVPKSVLDTDLYKLTMQQAVLHHFPTTQATYRFTNRDKDTLFSRQCIGRFRTAISHFTNLRLTTEERQWLQDTCPFLKPNYLDYLSEHRFKPEQVRVTYVPITDDGMFGNVEMEASGPWVEAILWEVPLMACLSESYFQSVITDWDYKGQEASAYAKGCALLQADCVFSDFGTRRRRSFHVQDLVVQALVRASKDVHSKGAFSGTSNVHLARTYGLTPIGTIAHEWFMGVAALRGYENSNSVSLALWEEVYTEKSALIALTDTFSTHAFFKDFVKDPELARRWSGLRQDSGDPFDFAPRVVEVYRSLEINPWEKRLVYSDSLSVDKALRLKKQTRGLGLENVSFGIGTFFTNDFKKASSGGTEKSKPLNMVIKLASVDGYPCIKISDDLTKNTGDKATVDYVKRLYNLPLSINN